MNKIAVKTMALAMAACLAAGSMSVTTFAASKYDDFDYITSHVSLALPQQLTVTRPTKSIKTSATAYYITGSSNPDSGLYLNGNPVENRGGRGSFAVYVSLDAGDNYFEFTQDDGSSQSFTITQGSGYGGEVSTTKVVSSMYPSYDAGELGGTEITLQCIAPSGASVTATVNGENVQMNQVAPAQDGVAATFKAGYTVPSPDTTTNIGKVQYTMSYNGATKTYTSAGQLFAGGEALLIQVADPSASIFVEGSTSSNFITTSKIGATDYVTDSNASMYKLGMGGWVKKDSTKPIINGTAQNNVSNTAFSKTAYGERFSFTGTAQPIATTSRGTEALTVTLHHTAGIADIPTGDSSLFSGASVTEQNGDTTITLNRNSADLWGYVVEYENNVTTIYCKYPPTLSGDSAKPLTGIVVALDAGHGGSDPGALGIMNGTGIGEASINKATTIAVQKRLESLGATVLLSGGATITEGTASYVQRMMPAYTNKADFFLSLHCNSIGVNQNGLKPNGIEIYYYEGTAKNFANTLLNHMVAETGRNSRGAKYSNFRVTLNSCAPSVLVEMGFLPNPIEFDSLASKQGIFNMANAVGDALVEYLS